MEILSISIEILGFHLKYQVFRKYVTIVFYTLSDIFLFRMDNCLEDREAQKKHICEKLSL